MNPLYTIIIPHYENYEDIERLLASIPANNDFEVIVVDDYSSSACFNRLSALKKQYRFELFQNSGTKSAGTCRNIGIDNAHGKWVIFADSDDFFLESFENKIHKYYNSSYDIVFFTPTSMFYKSKTSSSRHLPHLNMISSYIKAPTMHNEYRLRLAWKGPCSKLFNLSFIKQNDIRFDEVIVSNDEMFSLKSGIKAKTICASLDSIYCYVARKGSLENRYTRKILETRIRIANKHRTCCEKLGFPEYGDNPLVWLYQARFLKFQDILYLIRFSKKLGVLKNFSLPIFIKGCCSYLFKSKTTTPPRSSLLVTS